MTGERICVRCGWLVLDSERCARDHGPTVEWRTAARAFQVRTLRDVLHLTPDDRVLAFIDARDRLKGKTT